MQPILKSVKFLFVTFVIFVNINLIDDYFEVFVFFLKIKDSLSQGINVDPWLI